MCPVCVPAPEPGPVSFYRVPVQKHRGEPGHTHGTMHGTMHGTHGHTDHTDEPPGTGGSGRTAGRYASAARAFISPTAFEQARGGALGAGGGRVGFAGGGLF